MAVMVTDPDPTQPLDGLQSEVGPVAARGAGRIPPARVRVPKFGGSGFVHRSARLATTCHTSYITFDEGR